ncbi:PQQ-dependent sugar dehydrogenase [Emcibacter sp. SYSU 3D8]|uniref:PQQ-dependent sugar dehydrogenase n=1 Tax=Emcibacter sp. SYSU 3D8 TaxID=3133969 RepID=UPI0031FECAB1
MTNRRRRSLVAVMACCLMVWIAGPSAAAKEYVVETVLTGLDRPWSLTFLPDGAMLLTGHKGTLRTIRDGRMSAPISGVPAVEFDGQGGLFEALAHPRFAENGLVYLSYAHKGEGGNTLRVARARLDREALKDLKVVFESKPAHTAAVHYGGRMVWLPDGTLLITNGDGFTYREQAQNLASDFGKIVRINDDGTVPADNPFAGRKDARPEIWTYGHRNPQGMVLDPADGVVYAHEHGPRGGDELNVIVKGRNYGWPLATKGVDYSGAHITPFKEYKGTENAIIGWTPSIAPCGLAIYRGDAFPQWDGDLFVGALAGRSLHRVDMQGGKVTGEEVMLKDMKKRIRDVRTGPDGLIYVLTDGEGAALLRLRPPA